MTNTGFVQDFPDEILWLFRESAISLFSDCQ